MNIAKLIKILKVPEVRKMIFLPYGSNIENVIFYIYLSFTSLINFISMGVLYYGINVMSSGYNISPVVLFVIKVLLLSTWLQQYMSQIISMYRNAYLFRSNQLKMKSKSVVEKLSKTFEESAIAAQIAELSRASGKPVSNNPISFANAQYDIYKTNLDKLSNSPTTVNPVTDALKHIDELENLN